MLSSQRGSSADAATTVSTAAAGTGVIIAGFASCDIGPLGKEHARAWYQKRSRPCPGTAPARLLPGSATTLVGEDLDSLPLKNFSWRTSNPPSRDSYV